jgi:hypothetical protein
LQKHDSVRSASSLVPSFAALLIAGCITAGAAPPEVAGAPDAKPAGPADASPPDAPPPITCKEATNTVVDGHHKPGLDCMSGNCHGPAGGADGAPLWTIAGTLYKSEAGTIPDPYATITIVDAAGVSLDLVTTLDGNFYTNAPLTPPLKVRASSCPDLAPMVGAVQYGSCNACHKLGGTQTPIHLP